MSMRSIVSLLAAALLAAPSFAAEPSHGAAPGKAAPATAAQPSRSPEVDHPAFAQLDKNKDGVILLTEFGRERAEAFRILDADGDGAVSPEEYRLGADRRDLLADMAASFLIRWDENQNGRVEKKEFRGRPGAFAEADRDADNALGFAELCALLGSGKPIQYSPRKFFAAHDLDGDGVITQDESQKTGEDKEIFRLMDSNGDGATAFAEAQYFLFRYERRLWPADPPKTAEEKREEAKKAAGKSAEAKGMSAKRGETKKEKAAGRPVATPRPKDFVSNVD